MMNKGSRDPLTLSQQETRKTESETFVFKTVRLDVADCDEGEQQYCQKRRLVIPQFLAKHLAVRNHFEDGVTRTQGMYRTLQYFKINHYQIGMNDSEVIKDTVPAFGRNACKSRSRINSCMSRAETLKPYTSTYLGLREHCERLEVTPQHWQSFTERK